MEVIKREERIVKKGKKFLFYISDPAFLVGTSNLTSAKKPLMMKIVNQLLKKNVKSRFRKQGHNQLLTKKGLLDSYVLVVVARTQPSPWPGPKIKF